MGKKNQTTVRLGALTLIGEPCCSDSRCDRAIVTGFSGGEEAKLRGDEWQSLASVAAVVEAAREWRDCGPGQSHCEEEDCPCTSAVCQLKTAIDALNATRDGGK